MKFEGENEKHIMAVLNKDSVINGLISKFGLPPSHKGENIFNDLVRSIVGQQLSVKAAQTIYGRFLSLFESFPEPEDLLTIDSTKLREAGLSGQKASYLINVASFFIEKHLIDVGWEQMSDNEIIELLTQIKGVGIWTTKMLLLFSFKRPDVFPYEDLGIRMGMQTLYELKSEGKELQKEIIEIAEYWKPYRSIASKLIWIGKDQK